jgi:hypothetical protein
MEAIGRDKPHHHSITLRGQLISLLPGPIPTITYNAERCCHRLWIRAGALAYRQCTHCDSGMQAAVHDPFILTRDEQLYARCYWSAPPRLRVPCRMSPVSPPLTLSSPIRSASLVCSCSEENVYKLCERLLRDCRARDEEEGDGVQVEVFAVLISNARERVLVFEQRAGDAIAGHVVWDYHVICVAVTRPRSQSTSPSLPSSAFTSTPLPDFLCRSTPPTSALVFDLDSRLAFPCSFSSYARRALLPAFSHSSSLHPLFRVVPASAYLSAFASDRSHMLDEERRYLAAPPPWPCIGEGMNLPLYKAMSEEEVWPAGPGTGDDRFGAVLTVQQLVAAFGGTTEQGVP